MSQPADFTLNDDGTGAAVVAASGAWLVGNAGALDASLRAISGPVARIDLSAVEEIDTVGAWLVARLAQDTGAPVEGASDKAGRLIAAVEPAGHIAPPEAEPSPPGWLCTVDKVGAQVISGVRSGIHMIGFMGLLIGTMLGLMRHPGRVRGNALVRQMQLVGIDSLAIIGLMSFLIGIVIAQQGAVQLEQFGAQIYTINLTGRLAMRELGILMTAIMIAGRSGSAFAAQLGTMKLTEEVDAMRVIGVSPAEALVLPRVLATVLMMPLLGFYSAVVAIIGGAVIGHLTLDIPFLTFLMRIREVVPSRDIWVGLLKAPVFGLIIALTGCYQGMQVSGNSEEVGHRTTKAVVQAIFMVIVLDAFFAVFFSEIGWG